MSATSRALISTTLVLLTICGGSAARIEPMPVTLIHTPAGGIQPQIVERDGVLHMVYFSGDPEHGDLNYVRSRDFGRTFSPPLRVNSQPGSSIAIGNMRGAQLAVGRNGRIHVAWYGSNTASPRGSANQGPMLYARMNDAGTAFEPERNVISSAWGMDGGTLAADKLGNVYVFWHAPIPGRTGEENRRVWMARSSDDGKTFGSNVLAFDNSVGACGCCGMRAFAGADNAVHVLFRSAFENVHRDMYLLTSTDQGRTFRGADIAQWNIGACVMSTEAFLQTASGLMTAWETEKQVYFGRVSPGSDGKPDSVPTPIGAPGVGANRKYPVLAANTRGDTLLGWTENMAWKKGGTVEWQVYDRDLKPTGVSGKADGVPVWSLVAAFAKPDGSFVVVY
jgi:hypothetical protein